MKMIFSILFRLQTDGWVEVIIMLFQLFDVAVVEAGAELGKKCAGRGGG